MTPAGVGKFSPGDSKTAVSDSLKEHEPTKLITKPSPRRRRKTNATPQQAQLS